MRSSWTTLRFTSSELRVLQHERKESQCSMNGESRAKELSSVSVDACGRVCSSHGLNEPCGSTPWVSCPEVPAITLDDYHLSPKHNTRARTARLLRVQEWPLALVHTASSADGG